jgi:hypothetical protein
MIKNLEQGCFGNHWQSTAGLRLEMWKEQDSQDSDSVPSYQLKTECDPRLCRATRQLTGRPEVRQKEVTVCF